METDHRVKRGTDNLDGTQQCGTLRIYRELDTGRCVSRCHKGYLTHRTGLTSGECKREFISQNSNSCKILKGLNLTKKNRRKKNCF